MTARETGTRHHGTAAAVMLGMATLLLNGPE